MENCTARYSSQFNPNPQPQPQWLESCIEMISGLVGDKPPHRSEDPSRHPSGASGEYSVPASSRGDGGKPYTLNPKP